ncbi:MAG: hypothetical protein M3364_00045 [Actinomycetota bacterium]|nr:hypothetical protein [Actinomycetota bacterium]
MTLVALTNGVELAWGLALVVGLVVAVVVWTLLEILRRAVRDVNEGATAIWTAGKLVAQNTQTTHLLSTTKARGGDLLAELGEHARLGERSER